MQPETVMVIVAVITLFLGVISHIAFSVWWASKITTTLGFLRIDVSKIEKHQDGYYTKEEAIKELTKLENQIAGGWKRHDELRMRVDSVEKDVAVLKSET